MKVAVLAGGNSPERDVSYSSGCMISNALAEKGHEVALIDVYLGINTPFQGLQSLFKKYPDYQKQSYKIPTTPPDLEKLAAQRVSDTGMFFGENILELCRLADVVFLALHGSAGENGQLQATFDLLNIHYTGTGFAGCVLAMDKHLAKEVMVANDLPTAPWVYLDRYDQLNWDQIDSLGYPCVIKPPRGGSSIGVSIPQNKEEFLRGIQAAIASAEDRQPDLLVEKYLAGREFCIGILEGISLPAIEIIPNEGWFDYEKKYQSGLTREVCPAEIPEELSIRLQDTALKIHRALKLGYYSRIDFKVDGDGNIYCLEANTLPGMTPTSLFPQEAAAVGIGYADLCDKIVRNTERKEE